MRQTLLLIVGLIVGCTVQAKNRVMAEPHCISTPNTVQKTGYGLPRKVTCKTITEKLTYYAPA